MCNFFCNGKMEEEGYCGGRDGGGESGMNFEQRRNGVLWVKQEL